MFDIASQLLIRHSPFAPLGQVDEWTVKPSPFSIQVCLSKFFRIMAAKTLKNMYRLRTETFKLSSKRKKTKIWKGKPKVTYLVALVLAFLVAENENRPLEDFPWADFGRVTERFLLSVRTKSITGNFAYWKLGFLFVLKWFNACSHSECANALYDFYTGIVD